MVDFVVVGPDGGDGVDRVLIFGALQKMFFAVLFWAFLYDLTVKLRTESHVFL